MSQRQPVKMAAMEGVFQTQAGAPTGDHRDAGHGEAAELMDPIEVPGVLSYLAYGDRRAKVTGLNDIPKDLHPPSRSSTTRTTSWWGSGRSSSPSSRRAAFLLWRGKLYSHARHLWMLMLAMPFPYIANEAGWMVAEVGRQPWVVYGLQRMAHATSTNVAPA